MKKSFVSGGSAVLVHGTCVPPLPQAASEQTPVQGRSMLSRSDLVWGWQSSSQVSTCFKVPHKKKAHLFLGDEAAHGPGRAAAQQELDLQPPLVSHLVGVAF